MAGRPFMKLRLEELAERAATRSEDRALVVAELRHRTTKGAQRLLARLGDSGSAGATDVITTPDQGRQRRQKRGAQARAGRRGRAHSDEAVADAQVGVTAVLVPRPEGVDPDLVCRYEILRNTFTVEGEILARWGMTDEVPADIEAAVFEMWRSLLSAGPDHRGRSLRCLENDIRRLADERSLPSARRGGNPNGG